MIERNRRWGPRKRLMVTAMSVAVGLAPVLGAQNALAASAPTASSTPAVEVCGLGAAIVKPTSVVLTCADRGMVADNLHWTSWTSAGAAATATVAWGEDGSRESTTADITLSAPVSEAGRKVLFTRLGMQVTGATPRGFMRTVTFSEVPVPAVSPVRGRGSAKAGSVTPAASGGSGYISYADIAGYWELAGGPSSVADIAAAIAGAESYGSQTDASEGGEPGAIQPGEPYATTGWGLWQITPGDKLPEDYGLPDDYGIDYQLLDPWNNAESAVYVYDVGGFGQWATYISGAYKSHLSPAESASPNTDVTDPGQFDPTLDYGTTVNGSNSDPGATYGPAIPTPNGFQASFETNANYLGTRSSDGTATVTTLGMASGTSPSVAGLSDGSTYISAFQSNDNYLYLTTSTGTNISTTLGMEGGTSPAVAALANNDEWEAAFQTNANFLGLRSSDGTATVTTLGMEPGTSPAIAGSGGGWIAAFQDNDDDLYIVTSANLGVKTTLGMQPHTSPAITALSNGGFAIAFQANTGGLYTFVTDGTSSSAIADGTRTQTQYGMNTSSSPAIASYGTTWEVAFETNDNYLYRYLSNRTDTKSTLGMDPGTSPAIAVEPNGSEYQIAFDSNDEYLYLTTSTGTNTSTTLGMHAGTSPAISTAYE
jgi:hypothetical protein